MLKLLLIYALTRLFLEAFAKESCRSEVVRGAVGGLARASSATKADLWVVSLRPLLASLDTWLLNARQRGQQEEHDLALFKMAAKLGSTAKQKKEKKKVVSQDNLAKYESK